MYKKDTKKLDHCNKWLVKYIVIVFIELIVLWLHKYKSISTAHKSSYVQSVTNLLNSRCFINSDSWFVMFLIRKLRNSKQRWRSGTMRQTEKWWSIIIFCLFSFLFSPGLIENWSLRDLFFVTSTLYSSGELLEYFVYCWVLLMAYSYIQLIVFHSSNL